MYDVMYINYLRAHDVERHVYAPKNTSRKLLAKVHVDLPFVDRVLLQHE